jgi:hypothetical protein
MTNPKRMNPLLSIYHCADDNSWVMGERSLARHSDHVFCVAHALMPRFRPYNKSVHCLPHGLSAEDLSAAKAPSAELPLPAGYGLYIGNINDRHDFELWEKLFRAHPDLNWLVVGPVKVHSPTGMRLMDSAEFPHVRFLGETPYAHLRTLIAGAAFGFCYLRPDHPPNRISSQKIVQFLAQGKPFFCSWFVEYEDKHDLLYMTDSHGSALEELATWLRDGEAPDLAERRRSYAQTLRFENLFTRLPFRL